MGKLRHGKIFFFFLENEQIRQSPRAAPGSLTPESVAFEKASQDRICS